MPWWKGYEFWNVTSAEGHNFKIFKDPVGHEKFVEHESRGNPGSKANRYRFEQHYPKDKDGKPSQPTQHTKKPSAEAVPGQLPHKHMTTKGLDPKTGLPKLQKNPRNDHVTVSDELTKQLNGDEGAARGVREGKLQLYKTEDGSYAARPFPKQGTGPSGTREPEQESKPLSNRERNKNGHWKKDTGASSTSTSTGSTSTSGTGSGGEEYSSTDASSEDSGLSSPGGTGSDSTSSGDSSHSHSGGGAGPGDGADKPSSGSTAGGSDFGPGDDGGDSDSRGGAAGGSASHHADGTSDAGGTSCGSGSETGSGSVSNDAHQTGLASSDGVNTPDAQPQTATQQWLADAGSVATKAAKAGALKGLQKGIMAAEAANSQVIHGTPGQALASIGQTLPGIAVEATKGAAFEVSKELASNFVQEHIDSGALGSLAQEQGAEFLSGVGSAVNAAATATKVLSAAAQGDAQAVMNEGLAVLGEAAIGAKVSFGETQKSGAWTEGDGTSVQQQRKDYGLNVSKSIDPLGIAKVNATIGTSERTTQKKFDDGNVSKSEIEEAKLTGVRASADVLGVELVDLTTGQETAKVSGVEANKAKATKKEYEKEVERQKFLGFTTSEEATKAKVKHSSGVYQTNKTTTTYDHGRIKKTTDRAFLGLGVETTDEGSGEFDNKKNEVVNEKVKRTGIRLNAQTEAACVAGVVSASTSQTLKNERTFVDVGDLSKSEIAYEMGSSVATSVGAMMVGNAVTAATGTDGVDGGSVLRTGMAAASAFANSDASNVVGALQDAAGAAGQSLANEAYVMGKGQAINYVQEKLAEAGGQVVASVFEGTKEVFGTAIPMPGAEYDEDGNVQRVKLSGAMGTEIGIGTKTKQQVVQNDDGSMSTKRRDDIGVNGRKNLDPLGITSIGFNIGKTKESVVTRKSGTHSDTTVKDSNELSGVRASLDIWGSEKFDGRTGSNTRQLERIDEDLCSTTTTSATESQWKALGWTVSSAVESAKKHEVGMFVDTTVEYGKKGAHIDESEKKVVFHSNGVTKRTTKINEKTMARIQEVGAALSESNGIASASSHGDEAFEATRDAVANHLTASVVGDLQRRAVRFNENLSSAASSSVSHTADALAGKVTAEAMQNLNALADVEAGNNLSGANVARRPRVSEASTTLADGKVRSHMRSQQKEISGMGSVLTENDHARSELGAATGAKGKAVAGKVKAALESGSGAVQVAGESKEIVHRVQDVMTNKNEQHVVDFVGVEERVYADNSKLGAMKVQMGQSIEKKTCTSAKQYKYTQSETTKTDEVKIDGVRVTRELGGIEIKSVEGFEALQKSTGNFTRVRIDGNKEMLGKTGSLWSVEKNTKKKEQGDLEMYRLKAKVDVTDSEFGAVTICGVELVTSENIVKTTADGVTTEVGKATFNILFVAGGIGVERTKDGQTKPKLTDLSLHLTNEGVMALGTGVREAVKCFAQAVREGKTSSQSDVLAALRRSTSAFKRAGGRTMMDLLLTQISTSLCDEASAHLVDALPADKWMSRLAPVLGAGTAALVRPIVEAFVSKDFSLGTFTTSYAKQLLLTGLRRLCASTALGRFSAYITACAGRVYDLIVEGRAKVNLMDLIYELLPLLCGMIFEAGLIASGGSFWQFAIENLLVPIIWEILQTEAANKVWNGVNAALLSLVTSMKKRIDAAIHACLEAVESGAAMAGLGFTGSFLACTGVAAGVSEAIAFPIFAAFCGIGGIGLAVSGAGIVGAGICLTSKALCAAGEGSAHVSEGCRERQLKKRTGTLGTAGAEQRDFKVRKCKNASNDTKEAESGCESDLSTDCPSDSDGCSSSDDESSFVVSPLVCGALMRDRPRFTSGERRAVAGA